jgi:hypothetical protein
VTALWEVKSAVTGPVPASCWALGTQWQIRQMQSLPSCKGQSDWVAAVKPKNPSRQGAGSLDSSTEQELAGGDRQVKGAEEGATGAQRGAMCVWGMRKEKTDRG